MDKIRIDGKHAKFIGNLLSKHLRDAGLKVNAWYDVTPSEVSNCRRDATRCRADVSIVSMSR